MNTLNTKKGLNIGSGKWSFPNWIALDEKLGQTLHSNSRFPFESSTFDFVYSCHFFEHVNDQAAQNLFDEAFRVLKPKGIFRVVVPDFVLLVEMYKKNDTNFFSDFKGRPEWPINRISASLENILLHWLCNYDEYDDDGNLIYRGPPKNLSSEVSTKCQEMNVEDFIKWAQSNVPINKNTKTQHINYWTFNKFETFCRNSGFSKSCESTHKTSCIPEVASTNYFDDWVNREKISLYFESIK